MNADHGWDDKYDTITKLGGLRYLHSIRIGSGCKYGCWSWVGDKSTFSFPAVLLTVIEVK